MRRSKRRFDEQLERLMAGDEVREVGEDVAVVVTQLQSNAEGRNADNGLATTLAVEATNAESSPVRARSRTAKPLPTRWRRRIMLSTFLSSLLGKLAVSAVALATTTGGLAATGNLPDPAQDWASEQLDSIGIEIPESDHQADDTASAVVDVIENSELEGDEFGQEVADTASDSKSSDGLDTADEGADNSDVASEHTDEVDNSNTADDFTDAADEGADNSGNADDHTDAADEGAENSNSGDDYTDDTPAGDRP